MRMQALGWLAGLALIACSSASQSPQSTSPPVSAVTPIAPPIKSPIAPTLQPIAAAVNALKFALRQNDPHLILPLLGKTVLLEGTTSQMLSREAAFQWLAARWGTGMAHEVTTTNYVEHFVLLEVNISGWVRIGDVTSEVITFNLHRYDDNGKGDALGGRWRIDAIFFQ